MTKVDQYRDQLRGLKDWDAYLLNESRLPGPRANLELAQAAAEMGDEVQIERWLTIGPEEGPSNTPQEFLAFCGVLGLGRLVAERQGERFNRLRIYANDPRWRIREAVAMALQRVGEKHSHLLINQMENWADGNWLEKRAAAAGLAEPGLLEDEALVEQTLKILDQITASIQAAGDRNGEDFKVLRKGMGYCWSVAVAALPEAGFPLMEKWLASSDPDVRWIMKENLKKKRLQRINPDWVATWQEQS